MKRFSGLSLVAIHNLTVEELFGADARGALAVPSFAVLEPGSQFGAYGGITIVALPSLADSAFEPDAALWIRDVYTSAIDGMRSTLAAAVGTLLLSPAVSLPRCQERFNAGRLRTVSVERFASLEEDAPLRVG